MIKIEKLIIDEEIQSVIPPLDQEEFMQLKKNILNDGEVFQPLISWNGILIEYSACVEHPDRFELNSLTAEVEQSNRSN